MKRIIFSLWADVDDSSPWKKYVPTIVEKQKEYAHMCGANYRAYTYRASTTYDQLQFIKLHMLQEHTEKWDEVLYLDCDVIPMTKANFFETHDLDKVCFHYTKRPLWKRDEVSLMLASEGLEGWSLVANTGVIALNKTSVRNLAFSLFENRAFKIKYDYPDVTVNNEIYLSYIIKKYNVPYCDIGMAWNYIVDNQVPNFSPATVHFLHVSHKDFSQLF